MDAAALSEEAEVSYKFLWLFVHTNGLSIQEDEDMLFRVEFISA